MTVQGLSSLNRKINALRSSVKAEIGAALERGAQDIVDLARSLVPVDEMTLYESIDWTWGEAPKGALVLASSKSRRASDGLRITVYAGDGEAFYARWVEFGTAAHSTAAGGGTVGGKRALRLGTGGLGHPGAQAQPFFFPAYRALRKSVRGRITRGINAAARKQAKRS